MTEQSTETVISAPATPTRIDPALRPDDHRLQRVCDLCKGIDDHPHHVVWDPSKTHDRSAHHDCCAAAGCPGGVCDEIVRLSEGKQGHDLVGFIRSGAVAHLSTPSGV